MSGFSAPAARATAPTPSAAASASASASFTSAPPSSSSVRLPFRHNLAEQHACVQEHGAAAREAGMPTAVQQRIQQLAAARWNMQQQQGAVGTRPAPPPVYSLSAEASSQLCRAAEASSAKPTW